jgi:hypothetical protein
MKTSRNTYYDRAETPIRSARSAGHFVFFEGLWDKALPAAVLEAAPVLLSLSTFEAAAAAGLEVSFEFFKTVSSFLFGYVDYKASHKEKQAFCKKHMFVHKPRTEVIRNEEMRFWRYITERRYKHSVLSLIAYAVLQEAPDIRIIEPPGSRRNMSETDKAKMLKILEMSFEEYFKDEAP